MKYAEVALNVPVSQTFHYHIPPELAGQIESGHLVRAAFGTAMQPGIVVAVHDKSPVEQTKPILERLDPQPVVTQRQIELAAWMSERYLAPPGLCLWLMLPPGIAGQRDVQVTLVQTDALPADDQQARIVDLLRRRGTLRGEQIRRAIKLKAFEKTLHALAKANVVKIEAILTPPRVRPLSVQVAALAIHPGHINDYIRHLGRRTREADLLQYVAANDGAITVQDALGLPGVGRGTLNNLVDAGYVRAQPDKTLALNMPRGQLDQTLCDLRGGQVDLHVLRVLARDDKPLDVSWIYAQTGARLEHLKRLAELGLAHLGERQTWRDSLAERDFVPTAPPMLTPEQQAAWEMVKNAVRACRPMAAEDAGTDGPALAVRGQGRGAAFLLHGVTGSGKTEIYLRAVEETLARGRQAIFLVPEIALTAQTVRRVMARFPGRVAVLGEAGHEPAGRTVSGQVGLLHSRLSPGERYDTWRRARAGEVDIVVGTRSALFTPLPDVGLIILDEEHDGSYKQSPPIAPPYYHARDVAERMARASGAVLLLGSATPDVDSYFRAQRGDLGYLRLPNRILGHRVRIAQQAERAGLLPQYRPVSQPDSDALHIDLPPVQVVDMRAELKAGNTDIFSGALRKALAETLARGEQAILFMNRRGSATYVFCRDCGYVAACRRCDTPLTHHAHDDQLRCHHCGYQEPAPEFCPVCGSLRVKFFGAGTQHIEQAFKQHFPHAVALRWDADTASKPGDHDIILQRFASWQADALIGTQMVAKGLDLPKVTLVGVVSADTGLALPDFRAGEITFQLLMQVAGRAGRGLPGGRVILQTYRPEHYAVQAAARHDYAAFYAQEIAYRRDLGYPPFRRLARIVCAFDREARAHGEAERAAELLRRRIADLQMTATQIIGPAPCFFSRVNRLYRWHVLIRSPDPVPALQGLDAPRGWHIDIDPLDVL